MSEFIQPPISSGALIYGEPIEYALFDGASHTIRSSIGRDEFKTNHRIPNSDKARALKFKSLPQYD
ncbi:hypothetical protein SBX64_08525 [Vibrio rhizosphaerae]|uniref:Uncharacterized protein n=1 Tax=Vibrio rhizosphaerae TaxID=398736 RepID=A0ABU4IUG6_9VIBR|nr:hypothetical protein [Vibrio rhizosphaerae]MDW6092588.1 hypothetical protein [Vibrio rhizosphaerae]